jgi:thiol oxidase
MPEDVVVYLWKAHNIVNARLHGDEATEDPQFPKEQFPPAFLCPDCRDQSGELNQEKVLRFMLQYSTNIKPAQ